jgi:hypothetical protein
MHLFASKPTKAPLSNSVLVIFKEPIDKNLFQCFDRILSFPIKRELSKFLITNILQI